VVVLSDGEPLSPEDGRGAVWLVSDDVARESAVIAERFYGEPSKSLKVVGVTGTNGKTTVSWLVHALLKRAGMPCGLIGTVIVDDGSEVAPASLTTPPATELSRTLSVMVESGCRCASLEVSSHALAQGRVSGISFDVGVFTNLTGDHLDYHGTSEAYGDAKARLFDMLSSEGVAIVNGDDPAHERMVRDCRARVLRCSLGNERAECAARISEMTITGTRLALTGPWGRIDCRIGLVGEHNAMNALQACAACHALGVDPEELAEGLSRVHAPPGRLEPVTATNDPLSVFVDYAHTDDALEKVLKAVRPLVDKSGGRLWVVFGCGGDRDRTKRPRMGAVCDRLADMLVVTSDNPRTEDPEAIIADISKGLESPGSPRVMVNPDRERAISHAIARAREGDLVLIAGKGHEDYQILPDGMGGTVRRHFDDREVARAALSKRGMAAVAP
jgi:UDP-N-acetylmuramyl-tripeptide synthetase